MSRSKDGGSRYDEMMRKLRTILQWLAHRVGLPLAPVLAMADDAILLFYRRGDTIFSASQTHDFSYIVLDGVVRLECCNHRGRSITVQLARERQLFGVSWLQRRRPRALQAIAQTDVVVALLDQRTIGRLLEQLSDVPRLKLFAYSSRAQSVLVVQKGAQRSLGTTERLIHGLRGLVAGPGRVEGEWATVTVPLSCADLALLVGASQETVRHALSNLIRRKVLRREKGLLALRRSTSEPVGGAPSAERFEGVAAEWARPRLGELLGRCSHLGLTERAVEFIRKTARLYSVPDEGLLLPPDSHDAVAFVVAGSAWLEAAEPFSKHFALQLIPRGQFVRLPTRPSSRGIRMRGRAHRSCVVGLLTFEQMSEAMSLLPVGNQLILFDVTTRALSRQLCDCTTTPTRRSECRLLTMFGLLAHDFGGREREGEGILINVDLRRIDLARLLDVTAPTISKATKRLAKDGWIERVAADRYLLRKVPPVGARTRSRAPTASDPLRVEASRQERCARRARGDARRWARGLAPRRS